MRHGRIEDRADVAIREDDAVAVRPVGLLWVMLQGVEVEVREYIRHVERPGGVSGLGDDQGFDDRAPDLGGFLLKETDLVVSERYHGYSISRQLFERMDSVYGILGAEYGRADHQAAGASGDEPRRSLEQNAAIN